MGGGDLNKVDNDSSVGMLDKVPLGRWVVNLILTGVAVEPLTQVTKGSAARAYTEVVNAKVVGVWSSHGHVGAVIAALGVIVELELEFTDLLDGEFWGTATGLFLHIGKDEGADKSKDKRKTEHLVCLLQPNPD